MTKPIILVKICYKLLYVVQGVENSFDKVTSWPQNFWSHMPVNNVASDWPRTFLRPRCFCLAYLFTKSSDMLNKNIWGVKKCEANQNNIANRHVRPKTLISAKAKKLLYQNYFQLLE